MLDFTSALYLGLRHASRSLRPWEQLSTGRPAALAPVPCAEKVARKLAWLQGCQAATIAPSTLHLFWDLFGMLAGGREAIYMDAGVYPVVRWCIERAAARGVPVGTFPHHDARALRRLLDYEACRGLRPVVVADGLCPGCGPAPTAAYLEIARVFGGRLVLDDTQALGILGQSPGPGAPYGEGGGGMLRWSDVDGPDVLVVSSLAKGFGAPVAVLAGSRAMVRRFEANSETRVHCSPPSVAAIHTADRALDLNSKCGDALRHRLARLVSCFRRRLRRVGLSATGGLFPVQALVPIRGPAAATLHERLLRLGIRTVLHRPRCQPGARISFLITTRHTPRDIDRAVSALVQAATVPA